MAEPSSLVEKDENPSSLNNPINVSSCGVVELSSYDSEEDYAPIGQKMDRELWIRYSKQIFESDGFDVIDYPGCCEMAWIMPNDDFKEDPSLVELATRLAKKGITKFNSENDENYEVVEVEKVNSEFVSGTIYYITFQARKDNDELALKTFQTRVYQPLFNKPPRVYFCRIKGVKVPITASTLASEACPFFPNVASCMSTTNL